MPLCKSERFIGRGLVAVTFLALASCARFDPPPQTSGDSATPQAAEDAEPPVVNAGPCTVTPLPQSRRGGAGTQTDPTVALGSKKICFQGKAVADRGSAERHLIEPLVKAVEQAAAAEPTPIHRGVIGDNGEHHSVKPVHLLAPADTTFSELVDVLYTLGRGSFAQYYLGVETNGARAYLRVDPPQFSVGQKAPSSVALLVFVDGFRVTLRGAPEATTIPRDLKQLDEALAKLKAAHADTVNLVISAETTVTLGEIVEVLDVGAGPGCAPHTGLYEVDEATCRFPHISIEAGAG